MKKFVMKYGVLLLIMAIMAGCGTSTNSHNSSSAPKSQGEKQDKETESKQVDLHVGETGTVKDTLGKYRVTLNSVQRKPEIEGKKLPNESFLIVNITIKNIGNKVIDAQDVISAVKLLDSDEAGSDNRARNFKKIELIKGKLSKGQKTSGELVFDVFKSDYYNLVWNNGFSSLSNEVSWKITPEDLK
ncbi:MAG TPA: DUF4352 domain-containing protein [Bacillales bacterium]|nr:DUF4352 domain-containing protein [Bacillales bacterium]